MTQTSKYQLPDQGDTLVRLARDVAGDGGAAVAATELVRVRRADGTLAARDLAGVQYEQGGPLSTLSVILAGEAIAVAVWSEWGFDKRRERKSASKQVDEICRSNGVEAAVDWALANATNNRLKLDVLRDELGRVLYGDDGVFSEYRNRDNLHRYFKKHQM
jgi:hypothetical protein